ncbi:MAG TPA: hypothetical protein VGH99_08405 [Pseudonocardia sp.]|jgi:hypothetical protein
MVAFAALIPLLAGSFLLAMEWVEAGLVPLPADDPPATEHENPLPV